LFIRKYSYKSGVLLGLGLYAVGAFLVIPATSYQSFAFFCTSLYILTFGLAFLETTANPYILSLGDKETSTRRLNMAQAFNPVGSLSGMAVASFLVLPNLISDKRNEAGEIIYHTLAESEKATILTHDLAVIRDPYVAIGLVVLCVFVIIALAKMPRVREDEKNTTEETHSVKQTLSNLWNNSIYREGVFSQMCYVGAQIMVWTFIIQYAERLGLDKATAQVYNIVAMSLNLAGRFLGTFIMRYVSSRQLLTYFGVGALICTASTIFIDGMWGLYALVLISLFMSIMFPSIYGIALENVDVQDTKLGAAFLVMAIVGGALMPPLQGILIDQQVLLGMPAVNVSFILPLLCFGVVTVYGYRTLKRA
jgi:FHS family L-fucose permease-like MFS transporter